MRLSPRGPLLVIWCLCRGWAALTAERYEEAVEYATQAAEANPEFPDIYAVLASAYGHLGRAVDARGALDQLLQRMPDLTASDERLNRPPARTIGNGSLPVCARRVCRRGNPAREWSRTTAAGRSSPFQGEDGKVWNRRILPIAARPCEGLLTEPTGGVQPWRREPLFMPEAVRKPRRSICA